MKIDFTDCIGDPRTIFIDFTYVPDVSYIHWGELEKGTATVCTISYPGFKHLNADYAICSEADTFNKSYGRREALKRALNQWFFKEERTQIWKQYFNLVKK